MPPAISQAATRCFVGPPPACLSIISTRPSSVKIIIAGLPRSSGSVHVRHHPLLQGYCVFVFFRVFTKNRIQLRDENPASFEVSPHASGQTQRQWTLFHFLSTETNSCHTLILDYPLRDVALCSTYHIKVTGVLYRSAPVPQPRSDVVILPQRMPGTSNYP